MSAISWTEQPLLYQRSEVTTVVGLASFGFSPPPKFSSSTTHDPYSYQEVTDLTDTVHQVAPKTAAAGLRVNLSKNLQPASDFNGYVVHRRKDQAICWDVFPVERETQGWDPDATVLVDIGGGGNKRYNPYPSPVPTVSPTASPNTHHLSSSPLGE